MSYKGDIQATRIAGATSNVVISPSIRLRGIIVAANATSGIVQLKTTSATGETLFQADVPAGDVINFSFPEDGIVFPKGVYISTFTVASVTLLTDKYSGPGLTAG
tara:strand:+ start:170 stop:484 length:315 start_codon:yes stop_codon:yes gene_type:complete